MSINIGDNNKIKNANIAERLEINDDQSVKKSFYQKCYPSGGRQRASHHSALKRYECSR